MASDAGRYNASPKVVGGETAQRATIPGDFKKKGNDRASLPFSALAASTRRHGLSLEAERTYRSEERAPICERRPARQSIRRTLVRDIFGSKPDSVAIGHGGRIIAPATGSVTTFRNVTCESVIGVLSRSSDMNDGQGKTREDVRVRCAREKAVAREGVGNHAVTLVIDSERGKQHIIAFDGDVALPDDAARQRGSFERRLYAKPGDTLLFGAAHLQQRIHSAE